MKTKKQIQGKKSKDAGRRFELKVRKDLEDKGWIVDKWSNNVEFKSNFKEQIEWANNPKGTLDNRPKKKE